MKFSNRLIALVAAGSMIFGGVLEVAAAADPWANLPDVFYPTNGLSLHDDTSTGNPNIAFDVGMTDGELVVSISTYDMDPGAYLVYKLSTTGSWLKYTNPIAILPGHKTQVWACFTRDGVNPEGATSLYELETDMNGSFPTTDTAEDIKVETKGRYITVSAPGTGVKYDIYIYDSVSGNLLQSYVDRSGPISGESYTFPVSTDSFYIEYYVYKGGKLIARRVGDSESIDKTYMPEPYNLAFDSKTYKATASVSPPANMVEYELINTATNMAVGKNTTGVFSNIASGTYELRAVAYNSDSPTVRSQVAKLSPVIVDRDKPVITFVPVSLTGATAGVIVNAKDDGSGIDRIEAVVNEGAPKTINSGDTVYATKDGTNTITVSAYDRAGNVATESTTVKFDASGLSPKISVKAVTEKKTDDKKGTTKNPAKGEEKAYYNTNVEVTVTATNLTALLEYLILNDGEDTLAMKQFNPAVSNGSLITELSEDGEYLLRAQALSPGGTVSGGVTERTLKIDQTSPEKPVISLKNGSITITAEDNFSGIDKIEYQIDDGDRKTYSGPTKISGEGEVEVRAVAYDKAGNFSEMATSTFTIDNEPPEAPTISGVPDGWWKKEDAVVVTIEAGTDGNPDPDNEVTTYYRVGSYSSASDGDSKRTGWSKYKNGEELVFDEEGRFTVSAYCVDSNGNESDVTSADIKIDYTNPSMRASSTNFKTQNTRANFKLSFADDESGIDKIFCIVDGKEARINLSGKSKSNGYVNLTLDLPKVDPNTNLVQASTGTATNSQTIDPSQHIVSFRAVDYAGNESTIELQSKMQETFYDADGNSVGNSANKGNPYTGK